MPERREDRTPNGTRVWVVLALAALLAMPVFAGAQTRLPLDEVDALRIHVLHLEREVIRATNRAQQAEANLAYIQKGVALDQTMREAAQRAGVSLDDYLPDVERRVWVPREKK